MSQESPFKQNLLDGKVVLVTGGGSGIGFEIAKQMGLHGACVSIMGRREEVLAAAVRTMEAAGIKAQALPGDVRSDIDAQVAVEKAVSLWGRLDILVNAAAGNFLIPAEDLKPKGFATVLEIDTVGTFRMCHAAFPALRRGGPGHDEHSTTPSGLILNISAVIQDGATWYQSHASAAKAAIDSLTRSLALEWGKDYGIRVAGVAPGPVQDTEGLFKLDPTTIEGVDLNLVDVIPVGRVGAAWDIAMAALFIASHGGSWISGETLAVDGANRLYKPQYVPRSIIREVSKVRETPRGKKVKAPIVSPQSKL